MRVLVPRDLDDQQKRLLQEFDEACGSRALRRARRGRAAETPQLVQRLMAGRPSATPVVLFDLGGVLVHVRGFGTLASLLNQAGADWSGDGQAMRSRWLGSPSVRSLELGQIPPGEFAERFVDEWRLPIEPEAFEEDFAGWIVGPFPGAEQLVADLQGRGYHVSCLSNGNALHWEAMSSFLSRLDSAFSSHLLGEIKPDEQAFLATAARLGVQPADMCLLRRLAAQRGSRGAVGHTGVSGRRARRLPRDSRDGGGAVRRLTTTRSPVARRRPGRPAPTAPSV